MRELLGRRRNFRRDGVEHILGKNTGGRRRNPEMNPRISQIKLILKIDFRLPPGVRTLMRRKRRAPERGLQSASTLAIT
jgi:hypothetical protein